MVSQSENIIELAKALATAQGAMRAAETNVSNTFFHSKYADLYSCWEAVREPLTKNGLSVIQGPGYLEGKYVLFTQLMHVSGQWFRSATEIRSKDNSAQAMGSALTYARRYGLCAITGLVQADDDGNGAQGHIEEPKPRVQSVPPPKPQSKPAQRAIPNVAPGAGGKITGPQVKRLWAIGASISWIPAEITAYAKQKYRIQRVEDLDYKQYNELVAFIQANPKSEGNIQSSYAESSQEPPWPEFDESEKVPF